MTVRVTLDFESHDEALVFLARVSQTKVAAPAKGGEVKAVTPAAPVSATPSRKPRNDAGKARGPHNKQSSEGAAGPDTVTAQSQPMTAAPEERKEPAAQDQGFAATVAEPIPQTAPGQPVGGQPIPDEEACQAALTKVWKFAGKDQIPTCQGVVEHFGVKRIGEVAAARRAEFIARCEDVLTGAIPLTPAKALA